MRTPLKILFVTYCVVTTLISIGAVATLVVSPSVSSSPTGFHSNEFKDELVALYERIDGSPPSPGSLVAHFKLKTLPESSKVLRIDVELLPASTPGFWANNPQTGNDSSYGDTLAHFDDSGRLLGIEFHGSREGAFITTDPSLQVPMKFARLTRQRIGDLYYYVISAGEHTPQ